jgi:hypothetical protein
VWEEARTDENSKGGFQYIAGIPPRSGVNTDVHIKEKKTELFIFLYLISFVK